MQNQTADAEQMKEIEAKWAAESEDRIDAFERGELPAVDGPSALKELRSSHLQMTKYNLPHGAFRVDYGRPVNWDVCRR